MRNNFKKPEVLIFIFLVIFFIAGITSFFADERDFYPFYSYFYFWKLPDLVKNDYAVMIHEAGGRVFDPPILYQDAYGILRAPRNVKTTKLIREFGRSLNGIDREETALLRGAFEEEFLAPPVRYSVVRLKYRPLERFRAGVIDGVMEIATFRVP